MNVRAFFEIVRLELLAIWRSGTLVALTAASSVWMLALPYLIKGDGTAEGAREMYVRYSLGGVFALLVLSLLAVATGTLAKERQAKRLQLTMVRPVRYFSIALGKMTALSAVGALILVLAAVLLGMRTGHSACCDHVLSPVLPSPQEEARLMYDAYMKDPETPEAVRKAKRSTVLRLLAQRALDHYQTIGTNALASWTFSLPVSAPDRVKVRMRFTNQFEMRQDVLGLFRLGDLTGPVSNITQAVLTVPLAGGAPVSGSAELSFENRGRQTLMLRPRKDINLLIPADGFGLNLLRTCLVLIALLTLIIAFGTFLSAALGRPVALFVALATLAVGEMSPSVIEQYPDALETDRLDRIGLMLARVAAEATHPLSALSPLEALSKDECVEGGDALRAFCLDAVAVPLLLAFLSALVLPRKQEDV